MLLILLMAVYNVESDYGITVMVLKGVNKILLVVNGVIM